MPLETPGTDFRPLQVLENTDRPPFFAGCSPNTVNVASVRIMSAMRKVESGNIHAKSQHVPQDDFAIRGRTDGGNDLGPAEHTCPRFRTQRKRARMVRLRMQCRNIARYEVELSRFQITSSQSERRTLRWRCAAPTRARFCELITVPGRAPEALTAGSQFAKMRFSGRASSWRSIPATLFPETRAGTAWH